MTAPGFESDQQGSLLEVSPMCAKQLPAGTLLLLLIHSSTVLSTPRQGGTRMYNSSEVAAVCAGCLTDDRHADRPTTVCMRSWWDPALSMDSEEGSTVRLALQLVLLLVSCVGGASCCYYIWIQKGQLVVMPCITVCMQLCTGSDVLSALNGASSSTCRRQIRASGCVATGNQIALCNG